MKPEVRVLGIDDGPFGWDDAEVDVFGVVLRGPAYLEGVVKTRVAVDGTDATERLAALIKGCSFRDALRAVMLDGITLGGFNVVDLAALHKATRLPVLSVTRDEPDAGAIEAALRKHFPDADERLATMRALPLFYVPTEHQPLWVNAAGMTNAQATDLVRSFTVQGQLPEPVRVAHLIAAGAGRGESHGRA